MVYAEQRVSPVHSGFLEAADAVDRLGIRMAMGRDFEDYEKAVAEQPKKPAIAPQFLADRLEEQERDAFWLCGFNDDGELLHTQTFQLLDMSRDSVARYVNRNAGNYVPSVPPVILESAVAIPGPRASGLSGEVVYHGEFWIEQRLRSRGIVTLLGRYGFFSAVEQWDPDSVFGLMSWALVCDGFPGRIGYTHAEPSAVVWKRYAKNMMHQVWTVYLERDDLLHLQTLPVVAFSEHINRNFRQKSVKQ